MYTNEHVHTLHSLLWLFIQIESCDLNCMCRSHGDIAREVLCAHYDDLLVDITHPYSLVTALLQKQILDHHVGTAMLAEHLTIREKMSILADALITMVSKQPKDFLVLVKALEDKPPHNGLAQLLLKSHGKL